MTITDIVKSCYVTTVNTANKPIRYYRSLNTAGKALFWVGVGGGTSFLALAYLAHTEGEKAAPLLGLAALIWYYYHILPGKRFQN